MGDQYRVRDGPLQNNHEERNGRVENGQTNGGGHRLGIRSVQEGTSGKKRRSSRGGDDVIN